MAREYTFRIQITNPVTARPMIQLLAGATMPLTLMRAQITQRDSATAAQLGAQICRLSAAATVTAGVLATHVFKGDLADANPAVQLGTSGTGHTGTTTGTITDTPVDEGFNTLNGFFWTPVPEERITIPAAGICGLYVAGTVPAGVYIAMLVFAEGLSG